MPESKDEHQTQPSSSNSGTEQPPSLQSISIPLGGQPILTGKVQNFKVGETNRWEHIPPSEKKPPSFGWGILIGFILFMFLIFTFATGMELLSKEEGYDAAYSHSETVLISNNSVYTLTANFEESENLMHCDGYVTQENVSYSLWLSGDDKIYYTSYCSSNCESESEEQNEKAIGNYYSENQTFWIEAPEFNNQNISFFYSSYDEKIDEKFRKNRESNQNTSTTLCFILPLIYIGFTIRAFRASTRYGWGMISVGIGLSVLPFFLLIASLLLFGW